MFICDIQEYNLLEILLGETATVSELPRTPDPHGLRQTLLQLS